MHYHCEVWIPNAQNVENQIKEIMAPYSDYNEGDGENFWDWWQIGGRWKGAHVPDYNPEEDPENMQTCSMCKGVGVRTDEFVKNSPREEVWEGIIGVRCNACHGNGVEVLWPTEWGRHEKDIISVSEISDNLSPATLILPNEVLHADEYHPEAPEGQRFQKSPHFPDGNVKLVLAERGITTGYLVTIDYHG